MQVRAVSGNIPDATYVYCTLAHAGPGSNLCVYCAGDLKDNVFADLNFERGLLRVLGHVNLELTLPDHVEAS